MSNNAIFRNVHTHIFTVQHAPDYFLNTVIPNKTIAKWVQDLLQADGPRGLVKALTYFYTWRNSSKRKLLERYIEFIDIGLSNTMQDVFSLVNKEYIKYGKHQIVALTQVLDYLDLNSPSNHIKIYTQVEQVAQIKKNPKFTNELRPFLGCDPRMPIDLLKNWALKYINDENGFCGIKLYPAYGFFPFDKRFDDLWAWAEEKQIPIMTHCTRGGTWYLGSFNSLVNNGGIKVPTIDLSGLSSSQLQIANAALANINARISMLLADKETQKSNHKWCNIFGHPENFKVVLAKYPKLKICFAHFGGAEEINAYNPSNPSTIQKGFPSYLGDNWTALIMELIQKYNNIFTDISYTLSDIEAIKKINTMLLGGTLKKERILFGTDFFLTQQEEEGTEYKMQNIFNQHLAQFAQVIAYDNPDTYLKNLVVNF